ncbi:MAG TPA: alpha-1,2-fucosyltransferase [Verrucomicrobiae bacterium]|nr:alpha-1,2-fucosyltransferase [Verrucomicrobiae bacterium]
MVIVKIKEGLGNQLFQYAAGRGLAQQLGTELMLDTSFYEAKGRYSRAHVRQYHLDKFNITVPMLSRRTKYWIGQLRRHRSTPVRALTHMSGIIRFEVDKECGFDETLQHKGRNLYLDGYWQSERYFADIRETVREELSFREPTGPDLEPMLAQLNEKVSVCVHIRRGDYISTAIGREQHAICDLDYYRTAMDHIGARVPGAKFFLFSDEPEWVQSNFSAADNLVIVSGTASRRDIDDFRLMTSCRHFVIANSSFSWWAAWLGKQKDKIVVAPKLWRRFHEQMDKAIIPEQWVRL